MDKEKIISAFNDVLECGIENIIYENLNGQHYIKMYGGELTVSNLYTIQQKLGSRISIWPTNDTGIKFLIQDKNKKHDDFLKIAALATMVLLKSRSSLNKSKPYKYEPPQKSENDIKIEEYFEGYSCFSYESDKKISLKISSITLEDLKYVSEILKTEDLTFDVNYDYEGGVETAITWK